MSEEINLKDVNKEDPKGKEIQVSLPLPRNTVVLSDAGPRISLTLDQAAELRDMLLRVVPLPPQHVPIEPVWIPTPAPYTPPPTYGPGYRPTVVGLPTTFCVSAATDVKG